MSQTIDTLAIEIESNAANSVDGVRKLSRALTSLSKSISNVNKAGIGNVARDVNSMGSAFAGVDKSTQKASTGTKKYASILPTLTNHTNKAKNSTKSLAYYFGKFYANMFLLIRGAKMLGNAISDTMGYMESFNFWDVAINSATAKTDEWKELGYADAEAYAQAFKQGLADFNEKMTGFKTNTESGDISVSGISNLGINLTNLTTFQAEIVSITSSLGLCTSVSKDTSKALSMLVADMSSLKNIDLKTVMNNFQSGLIGQSRALYKYGIDITNATLQTYAYKYGVGKAVSEMTQAEKMQLRMLAILDQSKVAWGDLANTIEQPANQFRVLTNGIKNLGVIIGKILMPVVSTTLPYLNAMVKTLQSFFTWMANILGIKLDVKNSGTGTTDIFDSIEDSADDATESVNKLKKSIRSFDELNVIDTSSGGNGASSSSGGVDLSAEINSALTEYEQAWERAYANMTDKSTLLAQNFEKALAPVKKLVEDIKKGDWFAAGQDVSTIATGIFNFFSDAIEKVDWEQLGNNIGLFLAGVDWKEVFDSLGELIWEAITAAIDIWKGSFDAAPIETGIITGIALLKWTGLGAALVKSISKGLATISLPSIALTLSSFSFSFAGAPGFDVIGAEILAMIEDGIEIILPEWAEKMLGNIVAGLTTGAVGGSWVPGLGTFAGAVVGAIIGAISSVEIDGKSLVDIYIEKLFNFDMASSWLTKAKESFSKAFDGKRQDWVDMGSYIFEGVVEGMLAALTFVTEPFTDWFWWVWDGVCDAFGINSPADEMKPLGKYILLGVVEGFIGSFSEFDKSISKFRGLVEPWFSKDKWNFSGVKEGLKNTFSSAIEKIKELWNNFAKWINKKLTIKIDVDTVIGQGIKAVLGTDKITLGSLPTFANGGVTSADIFAANENGVPELIGTIGRKSAIASGTEVTGIADAVYSTASEEMALLRQQNELLREILAKPTLSNNDVFRATKSAYREEASRLGAQGNPALVWG